MGEEPPHVTEYFTGLAEGYDRFRPRYADQAITQALEALAVPTTVADVGCGTGIATRQFLAAGCRVVGVEPNAEMLAVARTLAENHPGAGFLQATAERTGLTESSVDLVVCAQAFHWFEPERALPEFHRILRPRGRIALMWNVRLDDTPVSAGYHEVVCRAQTAARETSSWSQRNRLQDPTMTGHFTDSRRFTFDNHQRLDREGLLGRARSASYFPRDNPLRKRLERTLNDLFDRHARNGVVSLRQRTELTLAERTG